MKTARRILSLLLLLSLAAVAIPAVSAAAGFDDVPGDIWYCEPVDYCAKNGLMKGMDDHCFAPDTTLDRAMFVTVLHRLAGSPEATKDSVFTDVPEGSYYADAVSWASQNSIVLGTTPETFSPLQPITREQMICMIARYATSIDAAFLKEDPMDIVYVDEADVSPYAKDAVSLLQKTGLILGDDQGRLNPQMAASRAEAAMVFMRLRIRLIGLEPAVLTVKGASGTQEYTMTEEETAQLRLLLNNAGWKESELPEFIGTHEVTLDNVLYRFEILEDGVTPMLAYIKLYGQTYQGRYDPSGELLQQVVEILSRYHAK